MSFDINFKISTKLTYIHSASKSQDLEKIIVEDSDARMSKGFNFTIPDPQPSSISARTDKYSKLSPRLFNPF